MPGQHQEQRGQDLCETCKSGRYQHLKGQLACIDCESGLFSKPSHDRFAYYKDDNGDMLKSTYPPPPQSSEPANSAGKVSKNGYLWDKIDSESVPDSDTEVSRKEQRITSLEESGGDFSVTVVREVPKVPLLASASEPIGCDICPIGWWTNGTDESRAIECVKCAPGTFGKLQYEKSRDQHKNFADCIDCEINKAAENPGQEWDCEECPGRSWTNLTKGSSLCKRCIQGQIFPDSSEKNCENCRGVKPDIIDDLGTYSFVAGGHKCHHCAPGRICSGGTETSAQWGWYDSHGLDSHRERLRGFVMSQPEEEKFPYNYEACAQEYMGDKFNTEEMEKIAAQKSDPHANGNGTHKPFECGDVCSPDGSEWEIDSENLPPGCTCKINADTGLEDCRFWCGINDFSKLPGPAAYEDPLDPLYFGFYMDQCGLQKKNHEMPWFQARYFL
jgi:hypothetical protein